MLFDSPAALVMPAPVSDPIVVTASRLPTTRETAAASVSLVDQAEIAHLGAPFVSDYLRLLPSVAVSISGPAGSQTDVRIRGAEANHTLLFIDGIRANDPAAGNAPRFELLNADIASRIELVRGPQSALWGSEAIGGVVAVEGDPAAKSSAALVGEAGSFATYRGSASGSYVGDRLTAAFAVAGQKSRGTDAFDGTGDRDGYDNASLRGRVTWQAASKVQLGLSGFASSALSEFDGFNASFVHADTLDNTRNRLGAVRGWVSVGDGEGLSGTISGSLLGSTNINRLDRVEQNRTSAHRRTLTGELRHHARIGDLDQHLVVALEQEDERFHARDVVAFGGATDQDRDRRHRSVTAEWRGDWRALSGDIAVRRDAFNRFRDATTVRASLLARLGRGFDLTASYGEGIAQPTFFDLYGFFPGSFEGNPSLVPESSHGGEVSLRWHDAQWNASVTAYRQRLRNEIVGTFDSVTFLSSTANATGRSRREGVESEAGWSPSPGLRVRVQASYLHATQPEVAGTQVKEVRRPKWSGAVSIDGEQGRFTYGTSIAYTGRRSDNDFDRFVVVDLPGYALANARLGYRITPKIELFGRIANAFDGHYRDVFGYRPSGRSVDGGIRLAFGG